jgi:hypothetical protein
MANPVTPLPQGQFVWIDVGGPSSIGSNPGAPSQVFLQYMQSLDTMLRLLSLSTGVPKTQTASTYAQLLTDYSLIFNGAGSITVTLLSPASVPGQWLFLKTVAAQTVVSASANVVPRAGGAAGTAILPATAGAWVAMQSDGTNWIIMAGTP